MQVQSLWDVIHRKPWAIIVPVPITCSLRRAQRVFLRRWGFTTFKNAAPLLCARLAEPRRLLKPHQCLRGVNLWKPMRVRQSTESSIKHEDYNNKKADRLSAFFEDQVEVLIRAWPKCVCGAAPAHRRWW